METLIDNVSDIDCDWPMRCSYWYSKSQLEKPKRKRREKAKAGLILTGNGLSIRVDKGRLLIKDGFTHYPQKQITKTYFKGALDIPPRIVLVDGKGSITLDALEWMSEQNVDLIRLGYDGRIQSVMSANGYAADPKQIAWQQTARGDAALRAEFARETITAKVRATKETLEHHVPRSKWWDTAFKNVSTQLDRLSESAPTSLDDLLGIEGAVASD